MPNQIPNNPTLPKNFDITPNEKRSKAQLDAWWDHPYCVTHNEKFHVYCLNGGAWDRPTWLAQADTYDEACELATVGRTGADLPDLCRDRLHPRGHLRRRDRRIGGEPGLSGRARGADLCLRRARRDGLLPDLLAQSALPARAVTRAFPAKMASGFASGNA